MDRQPVKKVVIAGGGTAGWVTAAALARQLGDLIDVTLIESEDIGTIGVGEATIPTQRTFHALLDIDEREFMRATAATFKLGIAFENWGRIGDRYIHSFGKVGKSTWMGDFHHIWLLAKSLGFGGDLEDYCFELKAAEAGKFYTSDKAPTNFAYHLDATLYAKFLRAFSEKYGAKRIEGKITTVDQDAESGHITALNLEDGTRVEGDFFIDCTGFRGVLIEQTLKTGYDEWTHWLPTNRALAVQTESSGPVLPYTRAVAHDAGWRWRIPLQHRVGNGLVYCSDHLSDDEAHDRLMSQIEGKPITEPRLIRYVTGRRRKLWNKNCVAIGLSGGFVEPLESTAIHFIQICVTRLIQLFPFGGVNAPLENQYNAHADIELARIRDFIILHYCVTKRDDSAFWRERASMQIPDTLAQAIELFREAAIIRPTKDDLFLIDSWLQVMMGQGLTPRSYHLLGRVMSEEQMRATLERFRADVAGAVARLPAHQDFVSQYCPAQVM